MANVFTGGMAIPFGTSLRIGYRLSGSSGPFTYITTYPSYNDLPYSYTLPSGILQVEYTVICNSCGGAHYSDPELVLVTVP